MLSRVILAGPGDPLADKLIKERDSASPKIGVTSMDWTIVPAIRQLTFMLFFHLPPAFTDEMGVEKTKSIDEIDFYSLVTQADIYHLKIINQTKRLLHFLGFYI